MSKLDNWVTIHFKENSIPSLRSGPLTDESKQQIKDLFLELTISCMVNGMLNYPELKQKVEEL